MATAATAAVSGAKAGFWIRFLAIFVDGIIIGIVNSALAAGLSLNTNGRSGLQILLGLVYYVYFWSSNSPWPGQTIGNKLLNIRVIRTNGSDLTISQALIRYVGLFISIAVIFIGVIWAAFDPNKQGWHDKIADTYVIRTS
ncbi:MAG TPA: RDD family protein [Candidatus Dormibacteraeota bacterium]|nr:RDD family protein [Candidatus Dormibacteraeota bacterium]